MERSGEEHLCPTQHVSEHQHVHAVPRACLLYGTHIASSAPSGQCASLPHSMQWCTTQVSSTFGDKAPQYCGLRQGCEIDGPVRSGPLYTGYHVSTCLTCDVVLSSPTAISICHFKEPTFSFLQLSYVETWILVIFHFGFRALGRFPASWPYSRRGYSYIT